MRGRTESPASRCYPAGPDSVAGLFDELKRQLRAGESASVAPLLAYPIAVRIDGESYELAEPSHFEGFAAPVFENTRSDLLDLGEGSIDEEGQVRVRNGVFTLASACVASTSLECAEDDRACATQRRSEQCRKREPRITGVEIFSTRQYTQTVANLRADLVASRIGGAGGDAATVADARGTGRWLFLSSSEERPVSAVDGVKVAALSYGDAPAGPHLAGSLRDAAQTTAFEFPAVSASALVEGTPNPDAKRDEVATHPGPLELEDGTPRPYLVIRWVSGSSLRFARITAVVRRTGDRGDGVTVTAASPDGRDAQALMSQGSERQLSFELDEIRAGQWADLAIGPRGSVDDDSLFVSLRVEAIEVGTPDREAAERAVAAILGGGRRGDGATGQLSRPKSPRHPPSPEPTRRDDRPQYPRMVALRHPAGRIPAADRVREPKRRRASTWRCSSRRGRCRSRSSPDSGRAGRTRSCEAFANACPASRSTSSSGASRGRSGWRPTS